MRLISTLDCHEGLKVAKPIYDGRNKILLNSGVRLTDKIITQLKSKEVGFIYVESPITEGVILQDDISVPLRMETAKHIGKVFKALTDGDNSRIKKISRGKAIRELKSVYELLLKDIKAKPSLINLLSNLQMENNKILQHSLNVSMYAVTIGRHLSIFDKDLYLLGLGAMFHDIGRSKLRPELLIKTELTEEEKKEYRNHTTEGFEMLRKDRELHLLIPHCAYQHHENVDGTGFPRGLKGKDIHQFAKIIAVADLFDKLTNPKSGKRAMLPHEAMEVVQGLCYTRFDPTIIDAFRKSVAIYPIGVTVSLNTGEKGVVVDYNHHLPQRPKIRVFTDREGNKLDNYYELDLLKELSCMIVKCDAILDEGK
ncbi:MAG: HD domain-containing phosphohydrolase [Bacillota bacterium]|nr:HD domain-containing phosphohydrolase [Bacillota bacterium]